MTDNCVIRDPLSSGLYDRLVAAMGGVRMPTGMLMSDVLHGVFLSEVRQRGWNNAHRAWGALDEAEIRKIGGSVARMYSRASSTDYELPAGSYLTESMTGVVCIDAETLGIDVDRPGLHPVEDLPVRPGGSNLLLLIRSITELSEDLPCRAIGVPKLVERTDGHYPSHRLQFPPFDPAGGVVLERWLDYTSWGEFFCAFSTMMVRSVAEEVVGNMSYLWANAAVIAPRVTQARSAAERLATSLRDVRVHAVTVGASATGLEIDDAVAVEFETWDDMFRRGIVVQKITAGQQPQAVLSPTQLDRADAVAAVKAQGADGRIEGLARAILHAAPRGARSVLTDLGTCFDTSFELAIGTDRVSFRLYWSNGVIRAESPYLSKVEVGSHALKIRDKSVPASIAIALRGKPLHILFDEPFSCDTPIACVENEYEFISVKTEPELWLVNCRTGRMWR